MKKPKYNPLRMGEKPFADNYGKKCAGYDKFINSDKGKLSALKKELGISQKDLAEFFGMSYGAFANSSAKERYENAIVNFYEYIKKRND